MRFRLLDGPPRLCALAAARLAALGIEANAPDARTPDVVATIDPHAIVDVDALRAAAQAVRGGTSESEHPAQGSDGTSRGVAVVLTPRDADGTRCSGVPLGTWLPEAASSSPPDAPATVALYGAFREPSGYAAVGRALVAGLSAAGVSVAATNAWWPEPSDDGIAPADRSTIERAARAESRAELPSVLIRPAGDASGSPSLSEFAATRLTGPTCALTMFECDDLPGRWVRELRAFDQVWVPSTFNAETFARAGIPHERLHVVPIGIDAPAFAPDGPQLHLPNRRRTAFLSVFDWNERKGTDVLLRAWSDAFAADDDVVLYLRTGRSTVGARGTPPDELRRLGLDPARLAPIEVLDQPLPADAYAALFRSVDAFVLTSRGEAFCIPMLEAMASGLPVIGTGFGGSADFLDETTGFPVPAHLVPVARSLVERIPFYAGQRWAEPSIEATVTAMRSVAHDPQGARGRAACGFARAQLDFDRRRCAQSAIRALEMLPARRTVRSAARAVLIGPVFADDAGGREARAAFEALARTGATPRVEATGAHDADLDPVLTRALRTAARFQPRADDAPVTIEALGRADAIDVTLWTPDARGEPLGARSVLIAAEPNRVDALVLFARLVRPSDDATLVLAPDANGTIDAARFTAEVREAMARAPVERWRPRVLALPAPLFSRATIPALATVTIALAADPAWPDHEYARACGVPVLGAGSIELARTLIADPTTRDNEGIRTRRAAVARANAQDAALRSTFDTIANLAPIERDVLPLRIAVLLASSVADPSAVLDGLRATARHTIVHPVHEAEPPAYLVRVREAVETIAGWDEALINALEARAVRVAESMDWQELAPNFPGTSFDEARRSVLLARNCEAGTRDASASGALQMVRGDDASATGPVWRSVACAVRRR
jgi:hypothetical protein